MRLLVEKRSFGLVEAWLSRNFNSSIVIENSKSIMSTGMLQDITTWFIPILFDNIVLRSWARKIVQVQGNWKEMQKVMNPRRGNLLWRRVKKCLTGSSFQVQIESGHVGSIYKFHVHSSFVSQWCFLNIIFWVTSYYLNVKGCWRT